MFNYSHNRKTIKEIFSMFESGSLIVDDSYQRRSVWNEKDKARLIETILLGLIIPELFFWKAETDPETGDSITHIVDGQQRIKAICSFINNEYKLKPQYLLDDTISGKYVNYYFKDFNSDDKKAFWNYSLMVIEIDQSATRMDIITMFNRLNLTDYSLNDQEKRNSMSGDFAVLARDLSNCSFWDDYHLFTGTDVKRMKDVEFCASLVLLFRKGIVDQTNQEILNQVYEELQSGYDDAETDKDSILHAIDLAKKFFISEESKRFLRKKTQLYTLFSVVFYMERNGIIVSSDIVDSFGRFVKVYSLFSNDMDLEKRMNIEEKQVFDLLKKYKLASSEGLNKHTNRMIRYNVLKSFLFDLSDEFKDAQETLQEKMKISTSTSMDDPDEY